MIYQETPLVRSTDRVGWKTLLMSSRIDERFAKKTWLYTLTNIYNETQNVTNIIQYYNIFMWQPVDEVNKVGLNTR